MKGEWILADVNVGRLSGLENKLVLSFKLAVDMVRDAIWHFVNYVDSLAFLKI